MDRLTDVLTQLENAELVRRHLDDATTFVFKHALTQESAYESLLLKKRREIHRLVADAYEELFPGDLDENAPLLAQHYRLAGDNAKAFAYAVRAGDAAARVFAQTEAESHYAQALEALAHLPDSAEHRRRRVDTMLKHVSVSLRTVGPAVTLQRLAELEPIARAFAERRGAMRDDRLRLARVQYWQGHALIHQNETRAAIERMQQVLQVAQAEKDRRLMAIPASLIGRTLIAQGQFAKAVPVLSDAVNALEDVQDELEWILATGFRGLAMAMLGEYGAGVAEAERALARATESNTLTGKAFAHGALGMIQFFGSAPSMGIERARLSIETAAASGDRLYAYIAHGFTSWAYTRSDDCDNAAKHAAQAQSIAREIGAQLLFADWFAAAGAERVLRCGKTEHALDLAAHVVAEAQRTGSLFAEGLAERVQGQAVSKLEPTQPDKADGHFANSLAKLEEGGARLEAARTRVAWSRAMMQRGDTPAARNQLEQAFVQFRVSGLTRDLQEAKRLIDLLSTEPTR